MTTCMVERLDDAAARALAGATRRALESTRGALPNVVGDDVFEGHGVAGSGLRAALFCSHATADELRANAHCRDRVYEAVRGWNTRADLRGDVTRSA